MRKPPPVPGKSSPTPAEADEPAEGRAMQRARQFALQRGLPQPTLAPPAPPKPAAPAKPPARKKP